MKRTILPISGLMLTVVACLGCKSQATQSEDPLRFPADRFTVETKTVQTAGGEKQVTYRSYMHIPYVANPVDKEFQSLNLSVPIEIDGVQVDAANAPILFRIGVGGYMSVRNHGEPAPQTGPQEAPPGRPGVPRGGNDNRKNNADLALAAGYVVVTPGCRGRDNQAADGSYYGKAPAAIVDLKAAVRYLRHNKGVLPGNTDWIISVGCSAGGALSALLGASGNSSLYDPYLKEIGAADAPDHIFGSACYSPITDLEHADMAYEWMYGDLPGRSGPVDQVLSQQLISDYVAYQASLQLEGKDGFGMLTADNYREYLLRFYLIPSADKYLSELSDEERRSYLAANSWIDWDGKTATFSFADYNAHVGRMKGLPAFDDFAKKQPEPLLFGNATTNSRHFTDFSLRQESGDAKAQIDEDLERVVHLMNATYFLAQHHEGCAPNWWLRNGTRDNHTSQTIMINLATGLAMQNKDVNTWLFWDGGHCADDDPEGFMAWIGQITGDDR